LYVQTAVDERLRCRDEAQLSCPGPVESRRERRCRGAQAEDEELAPFHLMSVMV
jgi:hypothetical protein